MGKSIWLLNRTFRLDLWKADERKYIASLSRVRNNRLIGVGHGDKVQTAVGDLCARLTGAGQDDLAAAIKKTALPGEAK